MIQGLVAPDLASYLKAQISQGSARSIKNGLQHLCELLRSGQLLVEADRREVERLVIGVLYSDGPQDDKVRRWGLNALARVGRQESSTTVIMHMLEKYASEPQTVASAVAALFALHPSDAYQRVQSANSFPEDLILVSALQHAKQSALPGSNAKINIEAASIDVLKLALVAIGLNRAPEHIFDPRHPNSAIVKALGRHHDRIVSQYSVWAICENPTLGLGDLGIPLKDIEGQPANVRAWMLRLVAADSADRRDAHSYVALGAGDRDAEVRSGLALGLAHVFYDGLQDLILDWHGTEDDDETKLRLLDHIVRQADNSPAYRDRALEVYSGRASDALKQRMRAAAAGRELYGALRRLDDDGGPLLFNFQVAISGGRIVNNDNRINIGGNVVGSSIAQQGNATTETDGGIFSATTVKELQTLLSRAEKCLHTSTEIDAALKAEALAVVGEAARQPTPENARKALKILKRVGAALASSTSFAADVASIVAGLGALGIF